MSAGTVQVGQRSMSDESDAVATRQGGRGPGPVSTKTMMTKPMSSRRQPKSQTSNPCSACTPLPARSRSAVAEIGQIASHPPSDRPPQLDPSLEGLTTGESPRSGEPGAWFKAEAHSTANSSIRNQRPPSHSRRLGRTRLGAVKSAGRHADDRKTVKRGSLQTPPETGRARLGRGPPELVTLSLRRWRWS